MSLFNTKADVSSVANVKVEILSVNLVPKWEK